MASLEELASLISSKTSQVSEILKANNLEAPTLEEKGFVDKKSAGPSLDVGNLREVKNELISAAQDLIRLAQGPVDHILSLAWSVTDTANLGTVTQFDIASKIPLGSTATFKELSSATGLPEDVLTRTVRYAIGNGIFCEPEAGVVAHSAASATLNQNHHVRDIALFASYEIGSILVKIPDCLAQQVEKRENAPAAAFNVAYPGYETVFEYFGKNPDAVARYVKFLDGRSELSRWSIDHLLRQWDWKSVGSGTIIDVGGSSGHTCFALAPVAPEAHFIVQDISVEAMERGKELVKADAKLQGRIEYKTHDFFTPEDVSANVYIFRMILHDWSDSDCVKIVKALLPALKPGARVLVNEGILPEPPATRASTLDRKNIRIDDHFMLGAHNAKERSVAQFIALFKEASEDFRYVGVTGGEPGVFHSLVDFIYKG